MEEIRLYLIKQIGRISYIFLLLILLSCNDNITIINTCKYNSTEEYWEAISNSDDPNDTNITECEIYSVVKSNGVEERDGWATKYYMGNAMSRCAYDHGTKIFCIAISSHGDTAFVTNLDSVEYYVRPKKNKKSEIMVNSYYKSKMMYYFDFNNGRITGAYSIGKGSIDTLFSESN